MSKKIFESETQVVWRGLDDEVTQNMKVEILKESNVFSIYATVKEFLDYNFQFPKSDCLALYEIIESVSDDFIINKHKSIDNQDYVWTPVVNIKKGIVKQ